MPAPSRSLGPAIRAAYRAGEEDETLRPIVKVDASGRPLGRIGRGDSVIFYDIRGEREVELTRSLVEPGFPHFPVEPGLGLRFVTMIEYSPKLDVRVAFPSQENPARTLTEVVTRAGLRVVKVAESEKAAHIGFFFNGRSVAVFPGEERAIVPSPQNIAQYDQAPEMSAEGVADAVIARLDDPRRGLIIANLANVDVVGHIENAPAVVQAVEAVDRALGRILSAAKEAKAALIVTADHGTVEEWTYPDGTVNTGHSKNPVPFILAYFAADETRALRAGADGELADVAPTVLDLLGLEIPSEMTGRSLLAAPSGARDPARLVVLLVLDGWGLRPPDAGNLIARARTPNFDAAWADFPRAELLASGEAAGMPPGTVGNSEAGHLHLGAGRRIPLDRVRIDAAIADGSFFRNGAFRESMAGAARSRRPLHLMGIISHYSSHGTLDHLFALLDLARDEGLREVYVHGFIGRRGERPESGAYYVEKVEEACAAAGTGEVVTVMGRYWPLDREENWDRIEVAYRALIHGEGKRIGNLSRPQP